VCHDVFLCGCVGLLAAIAIARDNVVSDIGPQVLHGVVTPNVTRAGFVKFPAFGQVKNVDIGLVGVYIAGYVEFVLRHFNLRFVVAMN
jgi:hypothetical protein